VGFFSNDNNNQQDQSTQPMQYAQQQPSNDYDPQAAQQSIDGVIPPVGMQQPVANVAAYDATTAPPVDDSGASYIMTTPPAQSVAQPTQQQSPAYHPTVGAPMIAPQTPAPLEQPAIDEAVTPTTQDPVPTNDTTPQDTTDSFTVPVSVTPAEPGSLMAIKQQALQQLSPLVNHLNQTPEERFTTTMMMLQATDDQTLVPLAYEAAQTITDDKARAQALLDVVNEINYFSKTKQSQ
jgi:hypothetical protein